MEKKRISNRRLSFYISSVYVGLGTVFSLVYWTSSNPMFFSGTLGTILFYLFIPVSFISIMIGFTEKDSTLMILVTQAITFFLFWFVLFIIIRAILGKEVVYISKTTDETQDSVIELTNTFTKTPYKTEKGLLIIEQEFHQPNIGEIAYLDDKVAPPGKYKIGMFRYLEVKNGKISDTSSS